MALASLYLATYNADHAYNTGALVQTAAGSFVALQPVAPPKVLRRDTFRRGNQSGWGRATDGRQWATPSVHSGTPTPGSARIHNHSGQITVVPDDASDLPVLGPPLATSDAAVLMRWSMVSPDITPIMTLVVRADETLPSVGYRSVNNQLLNVALDGGLFLDKDGTSEDDVSTTWTPPDPDQDVWLWTRVIAQGLHYRIRNWADGTPEPLAWDIDVTFSGEATIYAGHYWAPSIVNTAGAPGTTLSVSYWQQTAPPVMPGDDSAVWEAL